MRARAATRLGPISTWLHAAQTNHCPVQDRGLDIRTTGFRSTRVDLKLVESGARSHDTVVTIKVTVPHLLCQSFAGSLLFKLMAEEHLSIDPHVSFRQAR